MKKILLNIILASAVLFAGCSKTDDDSRLDQIVENGMGPIARFSSDLPEEFRITEGNTGEVAIYLYSPAGEEATALLEVQGGGVYGDDFEIVALDKDDSEEVELKDVVEYDAATKEISVKLDSDLTDASRDFAYIGIKCVDEDVIDGDKQMKLILKSVKTASKDYLIGSDAIADTLNVVLVDNEYSDLAGVYVSNFSGAINGDAELTITKTGDNKFVVNPVDGGALGGVALGFTAENGTITGDPDPDLEMTGTYSENFKSVTLDVTYGPYNWIIQMSRD